MALPGLIDIEIRGPLCRADVPGLCDRVCALLATGPGALVRAEVSTVDADAVAIEALTRLRLGARRNGQRVVLTGATPELQALVRLVGLEEVLPAEGVGAPGSA